MTTFQGMWGVLQARGTQLQGWKKLSFTELQYIPKMPMYRFAQLLTISLMHCCLVFYFDGAMHKSGCKPTKPNGKCKMFVLDKLNKNN